MTLGNLTKIFLFSSVSLFGPLDRIQKALEKKEYDKVEELIIKGYEKNPENPGVAYYHATLLFIQEYSGFNADSARLIIAESEKLFQIIDDELLEDLSEDGINLEVIATLSDKIRDFLFKETIQDLTVSTISDFRDKYPLSPYEEVLIFKRDSLVFNQVRNANAINTFSTFIVDYPESVFVPEADSLRDQLRFSDLIKDGTLQDYYTFIQRYPNTRWREQVDAYIFKFSIVNNNLSSYIDFLDLSITRTLKKKAADLLYYVNPDVAIEIHPLKDSLMQANQYKDIKLFPVMDQNKFGFYNSDGENIIPYQYSDVQDEVKCIPTNDDWIYTRNDSKSFIINRSNSIILEDVEAYRRLKNGLAIIQKNDEQFLYHKSGFKIIEDPIQDAEVIDARWIKVKINNRWGLYSFSGVAIAENKYEDISVLGNFWVFEKDGSMALSVEQDISNEIEQRGLTFEFKYDDLELVNDSIMLGFKGDREGMLNDNLDFLIPWGDYEIYPDPNGWYLRSKQGYLLYNNSDERIIDRYYPYLESNDGWLVLKAKKEDWILIERQGNVPPARDYDSIKLINNYAALTIKDGEQNIIFSSGKEVQINDFQIKSFPSKVEYLALRKQGQLEIYNEKGEQIITGKFQDARFLNDTLIRVTIRDKQGIIDANGEFLLNPVFESLNEKDGLISTLLKGKIGCYDLESKSLVGAKYEARIERINSHYLAKKDDLYGIVDTDENEIIGFSYDQITQWNDTSYLVSLDGTEFIINSDEEELTEELEDLELLYENQGQKIFRFVRGGKFGLISTAYGELLTAEFTDILNIGDDESPLFFADQHLSKAGFHVVSYINENGDLIFSKAYRKKEFDKILCDD